MIIAIIKTGKKLTIGCQLRNWWLILKPISKSYEVNKMNKQHIHVGVEDTNRGFERFVETWVRAEKGQITETEVHLNFQDLRMLLSILTPRRLEVLQTLRQQSLPSVRALSKKLGRDYKNVYTDVQALESVGLLERTEEGALQVLWDVIDAHLRLVA